MAVAGALLSFVVSVQQAGREGRGDEGRFVVEMVITESLGSFRNVARLVFMIAAVAGAEN